MSETISHEDVASDTTVDDDVEQALLSSCREMSVGFAALTPQPKPWPDVGAAPWRHPSSSPRT